MLRKYCILLPEDLFYLYKQCIDPDEMQHYAAFHLGLHCLPISTRLGVSGSCIHTKGKEQFKLFICQLKIIKSSWSVHDGFICMLNQQAAAI